MKDTDIMKFGKYKGKMLGEIPADYMIWLLSNFKDQKKNSPFSLAMIEYLESNMEYYKQQLS